MQRAWFKARKGRAGGQMTRGLQARPDVFDAIALMVVLCVDEPSS